MARFPRFCPKGHPQHIIQRGNNRQPCFAMDDDYASYACWLKKYAFQFGVDIHAWVFMTNHVHLLATPRTDEAISLMMQALGRRYVRYFNRSYQRTGTLWEGRFKSCIVQTEGYLLQLYRYIELNPVRAKMVEQAADFHWSSHHCNSLGFESALCQPHEMYMRLAKSADKRREIYRGFFQKPQPSSMTKSIRDSVIKELALGDDQFKREIENLYGRRVTQVKSGRPRGVGKGVVKTLI